MLHHPEAALRMLAPVIGTAGPYRGPLVEANILAALSADLIRRDTAAMTAITAAVDLAHGVGLIRPFRAAGPRMTALLTRHRHVVARHLDFTATVSRGNAGDTASAGTEPPPVERLTEREHAVLRYLPTMF